MAWQKVHQMNQKVNQDDSTLMFISKEGGIPSHLVGLEDKIKIKHTLTMVKFSHVKINGIKYPVCSALSLLSF